MKGETGNGPMFYVAPRRHSDVATVAAIERIVFTMPWSSSAFGYELRANPLSHYFVARQRSPLPQANLPEQDASIVGYGGFWMMLDEGHICTLGVHPDWRRRGVGELLLSHMIGQAASLGANLVTLEVRVSNLGAQQLYQKYGFSVTGLRKSYYSDNNEDALIMTTEPIGSATYQSRYNRLLRILNQRLALAQPQGAQER